MLPLFSCEGYPLALLSSCEGCPPRAAVFLRGVPPRAPRLKAPEHAGKILRDHRGPWCNIRANGVVRRARVARQAPGLPSMAGSAARSRVV